MLREFNFSRSICIQVTRHGHECVGIQYFNLMNIYKKLRKIDTSRMHHLDSKGIKEDINKKLFINIKKNF